jgi:hypothetical protein
MCHGISTHHHGDLWALCEYTRVRHHPYPCMTQNICQIIMLLYWRVSMITDDPQMRSVPSSRAFCVCAKLCHHSVDNLECLARNGSIVPLRM